MKLGRFATIVQDYWHKHYLNDNGLCSLCGNSGVIDTRGRKSAAGVEAGKLNWCICPNGMIMRQQMGPNVPTPSVNTAIRVALGR